MSKFLRNKKFRRFSPIWLLCLGLLLSAALPAKAQETEPQVPLEVKRYIRNQARKEKGSPHISRVVSGDINGDGRDDMAVNYAVEGIGGGNFSTLYIALFINRGGKFIVQSQFEAGSFGTASGEQISADKIEGGKILVEIAGYAAQDGACCPSLKSRGELRLVGRRLNLLRYKQ